MGADELAEIKTGNGIDRDLAATSNDRLKKTVLELRGLKGQYTHWWVYEPWQGQPLHWRICEELPWSRLLLSRVG